MEWGDPVWDLAGKQRQQGDPVRRGLKKTNRQEGPLWCLPEVPKHMQHGENARGVRGLGAAQRWVSLGS